MTNSMSWPAATRTTPAMSGGFISTSLATSAKNAAAFFSEVANEVEMNPPDIAGVVRVAASYDTEFVV